MKYLLPLFLLLSGLAEAASVSSSLTTSTLTLDKPGSVTLTWAVSGASKCIASGDWSGSKVVIGGTETVSVTKTSTFTLTCESPTGPATLVWTPPTKYSDGSTLTIKDYQVMNGPSATALARLSVVNAPATTAIVQVTPGLNYFSVRARDAAGLESADSNVGSKTIVADSSTSTVKVELKIAPNPPTNLTVE